jgi:hypothetical protein
VVSGWEMSATGGARCGHEVWGHGEEGEEGRSYTW